MAGMDAATGQALGGLAHLRQSVRDILATPVGSRVMRREYGSRLADLVDGPLTAGRLAELQAAAAEALDRWEPRLRLTRVQARAIGPGRVAFDLEGEYRPDGQAVRLEGLELEGAAP